MSEILRRYVPVTEYESYEDFKENYRVNIPDNFNFGYDVVDEWTRLEPDKLALLWTDDTHAMKSFTFESITKESNRAANLLTEMGVKKGDVVMLILKQRPEVWPLMTALCKIGAICIPGTYQLTTKDIVYRLNAADVSMIISIDDREILQHIEEALPQCGRKIPIIAVGDDVPCEYVDFRREVKKMPDTFVRVDTLASDPMLIYFSSGTTGMPKMVLHDHTHPIGQIVTAKYWQCVRENCVHMTQTDSGWAKFAWGKIYGQWICGAAIGAYDTEKFTPLSMLDAIVRLKPTTFCAPATVYRFFIKEDLSKYDLSFIKHASLAGEPLNPEVFKQIEKMTGLTIHEGFGQSESSVLLANFKWMDIKPGSMGKPAPIYDIDLLDEHGGSCEDGIVGLICVKGIDAVHPTGLFRYYYRDEEANCNSRHFGAYSTGDMAWRDDDGYYWFVGRNDDVIKCSGYRIGPFEVESALMEHPAVLECAVTAAPDPLRGQVVKATIVLARGYEGSESLIKDLQNHVKQATAPYKYPRIVEFTNELPKTVSGKIMRTAIRAADMQKANNSG